MARGIEIIEQDRDDLPSDPMSLATRIPEGQQMVSERTLFGDIITAQPIRAPRNEGRVLQKIEASAGAAGTSWYYRFPVKKKGGGVDYIEGPSIECTDAVSRWFGNCQVASAVQDVGGGWIVHSRFVDLETGYTLIRPFLQSKQGSRLGGDDDERRLQIAMSIGVSKSQRNVVVHALRDLTGRAFQAAKKNLVERIGQKLPEYRKRCVDKLAELDPGLLARVERAYNRKAEAWLAPDVARLIGEISTIAEGMALADEMWPVDAPPEPKRTDAPETSAPKSHEGETRPTPPTSSDESAPPADPSQPADAPAPRKVWRIAGDLVGHEAIWKALGELVGIAETDDDLQEIRKQNADRIEKFSAPRKLDLNKIMTDRSRKLRQPGGAS